MSEYRNYNALPASLVIFSPDAAPRRQRDFVLYLDSVTPTPRPITTAPRLRHRGLQQRYGVRKGRPGCHSQPQQSTVDDGLHRGDSHWRGRRTDERLVDYRGIGLRPEDSGARVVVADRARIERLMPIAARYDMNCFRRRLQRPGVAHTPSDS